MVDIFLYVCACLLPTLAHRSLGTTILGTVDCCYFSMDVEVGKHPWNNLAQYLCYLSVEVVIKRLFSHVKVAFSLEIQVLVLEQLSGLARGEFIAQYFVHGMLRICVTMSEDHSLKPLQAWEWEY